MTNEERARIAFDLVSSAMEAGHPGGIRHPETGLVVEMQPRTRKILLWHSESDGNATAVRQMIARLKPEKACMLVGAVLGEADAQVAQVRALIEKGEVPGGVSSFSELHDSIDANMLGAGAAGPKWIRPHGNLIGKGIPDDVQDEAWCGVLNCAHMAVDAVLRSGALAPAAAPAP